MEEEIVEWSKNWPIKKNQTFPSLMFLTKSLLPVTLFYLFSFHYLRLPLFILWAMTRFLEKQLFE